MLALAISLRVKPGRREEFLSALKNDATHTLAEPGCLRFDAFEDEAEADHFLLNTMFTDAAAHLEHRQTSHYKEWAEHGLPCVVEGSLVITRCTTMPL